MRSVSYALAALLAIASGSSLTLNTVAAQGTPAQASVIDSDGQTITLQAGHASLQKWRLGEMPYPEGNEPTPPRVDLGHKLFFDPRLSGDGNMSCATCHSPLFGWSDGLPTARGAKSVVLGRASPTVVNTGYNRLQMWDGRKKSLEEQATGPMEAAAEMNMDSDRLFAWLNGQAGYRVMFAQAYPGEAIDATTLSKAIASYERTLVSKTSPFDRWVAGDANALTPQQVRGFAVFIDPAKGNCMACHAGPNFTDGSFHNVGLASYGHDNPDVGRYAEKPVASLKGAFKTPTVREAARTAPYFHDGSAATLEALVDHYVEGGVVKTNVSKSLKPLTLSGDEKAALVAFMQALSSPVQPVLLPELPL